MFIYFSVGDFFPEYKCAVQRIYSLDFVLVALSECRRGRRAQPARRESMSGFIPAVVLRPPNWSGAESSAKHCRRNRSIYRERKAPEVSQNANDVGFEVEWISRRKIQKNLKQI